MIKTPLSTVLGGAFWTPGATIIAATFGQRIKKLFANGEQGFWYDPNDLSTMFQDAAGTVPVTAVGQAVGLIKDKSGRNNHAFQTTSASRPILRKNAVTGANYLEFDGVDDHLQLNYPSTIAASLITAVNSRASKINPIVARGAGGYPYVGSTTAVLQGGVSVQHTNPSTVSVTYTPLENGNLQGRVKTNMGENSGEQSFKPFANANPLTLGSFTSTSAFGALDMYGILFINRGFSVEEESLLHNVFNRKIGK